MIHIAASFDPVAQGALIALGNRLWTAWVPHQPYAFSFADGIARFEVRSGDQTDWDAVRSKNERAEIGHMTDRKFAKGKPFRIAYRFMLESLPTSSQWATFGQVHQAGWELSPPTELRIDDKGRLKAIIRNDAVSNGVLPIGTVVAGQWHDIIIEGRFGLNGSLSVIFDGAQVNHSGDIGFTSAGDFYWKQGIYRSPAVETLVARYADLSVDAGTIYTVPSGLRFLKASGVEFAVFTGSGTKFVSDIEKLNALDGLVSVLTDGPAITVSATIGKKLPAWVAANNKALSSIVGGYSFQVFAGPASLRRIDRYDADGASLGSVRI